MSATVVVRWLAGGEVRSGDLDTLAAARAAGGDVWVDVLGPDERTLAVLQQEFSLHPLAIEDCLHFPQRVKLDIYPEAAFLVWVFPPHNGYVGDGQLEMDVFLGPGFLITSHRDRIAAIESLEADDAAIAEGAEWTLHAILDRGVDDLFPLVDGISERLDDIENALLGRPHDGELQKLYAVKRELIKQHRIVAAERDALRGMARHEQFISSDAYMYLQNVSDHLERVVETIETYREVTSGAVDIYLSAVNNRLNDVMKRLTAVATIFMPLTFITGIFGMNLTGGMWPPPEAVWGFAAVNAAMLGIAGGMLFYFRRKHWL